MVVQCSDWEKTRSSRTPSNAMYLLVYLLNIIVRGYCSEDGFDRLLPIKPFFSWLSPPLLASDAILVAHNRSPNRGRLCHITWLWHNNQDKGVRSSRTRQTLMTTPNVTNPTSIMYTLSTSSSHFPFLPNVSNLSVRVFPLSPFSGAPDDSFTSTPPQS